MILSMRCAKAANRAAGNSPWLVSSPSIISSSSERISLVSFLKSLTISLSSMAFISVRTSTIRPGSSLLFDVFVDYKDTYLKYKSKSETFEGSSLERFKAKKIKKLFIDETQEPDYLNYLSKALDELGVKSEPLEKRADFARDTLNQESENIEKTLESETAYRDSESRIHKVVDFMLAEPKALASMLASAGLSVDDSTHSSNLSSLCLAVGAHSKFVDRNGLTDLAIAGLLHDVGLAKLGFNEKTDFDSLSKEDKVKYKTHPKIAAESVAGKQFITARVLKLIEDHEEYGKGLGFPNKKNLFKATVDSQIFNLCDAFDHYATLKKKSPKEAIEGFIIEKGEFYEPQIIQVLEAQVKG